MRDKNGKPLGMWGGRVMLTEREKWLMERAMDHAGDLSGDGLCADEELARWLGMNSGNGLDVEGSLAEMAPITPRPWTSEPPTQPGWYWWRGEVTSIVTVAEMPFQSRSERELGSALGAFHPIDDRWVEPRELGGEWSGPLEPPE